jgi:flagellar biosynthesis/type III secretory pathway protein FliH
MTEERIAKIERVIEICEKKGVAWTNLVIYEAVGGQYQAVARYLKQRRAKQAVAALVAVDEDPAPWADEQPQDTLDVPQEHDESDVQAGPSPEPLPSPAEPYEPPAPVETPPPRVVPTLEVLQQAARDADATLIRLTRERESQQAVAQHAALALHQAKREAQRLAKALRAAVRQVQATPAPYEREAASRVQQLHAQLADLVGAADAERIAHDSHCVPPWLRG